MKMPTTRMIVYFDDRCGFCNRLIQQVASDIPSGDLSVRSIWGPSGGAWARLLNIAPTESIVVLDADGAYLRSAAVLALLRLSRRIYLRALLKLCPRSIADYAYSLVGRWRNGIPGFQRVCDSIAAEAGPEPHAVSGVPLADLRSLGSAVQLRRNLDGSLTFVLPNLSFAAAKAATPPQALPAIRVLGLSPSLAGLMLQRRRSL
jgi:predicted DCC family thiol-disulfide oxidoreductase YuxK